MATCRQRLSSYVTVYPPGANGDVAPIQTISGSNTGINAPWSVAVDSEHNIYVDNVGADSITVFAAGANGNATPIQTISGSNTGLDYSWGIAADSAKNIYVTGTRFNLLNVFARGRDRQCGTDPEHLGIQHRTRVADGGRRRCKG